VSGVTVTAQNPSFGEFTVSGNLIVDDFLYAITPLPAPGTVYSSLVGILATRQNQSKLLPRSGADVVP
jgi:large repetitive protein